ncbi:SDR family oxidoreductase [Lysobacter enzymogenes]|uniref:SDR family oxidoreductase n=1 Tax=Lysobacter enzymogenes TaxID=69 RepID=UPI001A973110|nr:SDR family oxidoreductase [Lysobacter enzymogenes]QQP95855.1 SDR family oxidoreductase [Lysobacter enzymogenes]
MSAKIILITGASSGFGALTARALADAGHIVYAGIRATQTRNAPAVRDAEDYAAAHEVALRTVELDVSSQESVDRAVSTLIDAHGHIDVLVQNAGHMVTGPSEAFTPEQLAALYDVNVLGAQRLNRAALPHLRKRGSGLIVWVSSSSVKGGTPPYLGPYFAAKAAMDSLATTYALELARFGIETSIVVPGSYTHGTNHFTHSGKPEDSAVVAEYDEKYPGLLEDVARKLAALSPADADVGEVAREIARIVDLERGTRPYRVVIDPADDGSACVSVVADRIRKEFLVRVGLEDLLAPAR